MSIKITKDGITVEVDTESELRTVLTALGVRQKTVSIKPSDFYLDTNILIEVYNSIPADSKSYELLQFLKEKPNGVTKTVLIKELGLDSGQALGGVFGGIGRHAIEFGASSDDIYQREFMGGNDIYKLTDNMIKAIDEASNKTKGE